MFDAVIVIPCYNEAERLAVGEFRRFASANSGVRFLLVNDGSADATLDVLTGLARENPEQFTVCDIPKNGGKAAAVRTGILGAIAMAPRFIGFWDADLATPLDAIPRFCDVLRRREELQIVIGSRLPLLGHRIERRPIRKLLGRLFAIVASRVLSLKVRDTQCGAKMFRATPEIESLFREPFLARWIFDVEILARLIRRQRQTGGPPAESLVYELPLDCWRDVAGSKLKSGDFVTAVFELAAIRRAYLGRRWRKEST